MQTIVTRPVGQTYAISVTASASVPIAVSAFGNEQVNYAEFYNSGATQVCVTTGPCQAGVAGAANPPAAAPTGFAFPVAGTPSGGGVVSSILPGVTTSGNAQKYVIAVANGSGQATTVPNTFWVSAIGSGAGPSIIYITPVVPV